MSGTASGPTTTFVLGREDDGNRETLTYVDGQAYEVDYSTAQAYTAGDTKFPYVA